MQSVQDIWNGPAYQAFRAALLSDRPPASFGLDVGIAGGSVIIWSVFADTNRYKGMLTGTYTGASAEMSIAAGLGANILVGGSNRTVASQPLSVQGQIGLDIAAGVGSLDLHPSW